MANPTLTNLPSLPLLQAQSSTLSQASQSDTSLTRYLESNGFGEYIQKLSELDIITLDSLLSLTHPQLIEVARQIGLKPVYAIMFTETIVNNINYTQRHTINESGEFAMIYKLVRLLKRLKLMSIRDDWDMATDDIYTLIDTAPNQRELISYVEEVLQIDKNDYVCWDLHGLLNARRGFLADAKVCFQRSLVKNPNYLHARFNHARLLHYELKEYETAKQEYELIVHKEPNFSRAYNSYAKLLEKLNDLEQAEKYLRYALRLRPMSISYRHTLANILAMQNRHIQVQQVYQEAVTQHPRSGTLRFHHALALVKCKYYKEAEIEFKNAIQLSPNLPHFYHEYGKFCERHRVPPDYDQATDLYFKAFQLNPVKFLNAAVDAANLMRRIDTETSRKSSEQLFKKLTIDAPHLPQAFLGYSKLLIREGRIDEAELILKEGIKSNPKDKELESYYKETLNQRQIHNNKKNSKPSLPNEQNNFNKAYAMSVLMSKGSNSSLIDNSHVKLNNGHLLASEKNNHNNNINDQLNDTFLEKRSSTLIGGDIDPRVSVNMQAVSDQFIKQLGKNNSNSGHSYYEDSDDIDNNYNKNDDEIPQYNDIEKKPRLASSKSLDLHAINNNNNNIINNNNTINNNNNMINNNKKNNNVKENSVNSSSEDHVHDVYSTKKRNSTSLNNITNVSSLNKKQPRKGSRKFVNEPENYVKKKRESMENSQRVPTPKNINSSILQSAIPENNNIIVDHNNNTTKKGNNNNNNNSDHNISQLTQSKTNQETVSVTNNTTSPINNNSNTNNTSNSDNQSGCLIQ